MTVLLESHEVLAFLVVLCAIIFSWNAAGRRVVNAVVALQFLLGIVIAAVMGSQHQEIPPMIWTHFTLALAILASYGLAMRFGKQAGGATRALAFSVLGVVLVLLNVYFGFRMAGMV